MLAISASYALFGTTISVFLYGRKTLHLFKSEKDDEDKKEVPRRATQVNESEEITNDDDDL